MIRDRSFILLIIFLVLLNTYSFIDISGGYCVESFDKTARTIYIRNDGSVDPPDAPVSRVNDTYYVLTSNIYTTGNPGIAIERDNIILDGRGFEVKYTSGYSATGILLINRFNVTIKNLVITRFWKAVVLNNTRNSLIVNNTFLHNDIGIFVVNSIDNTVSNNVVNLLEPRYYEPVIGKGGIYLINSYRNRVVNNSINCAATSVSTECSRFTIGIKLDDSGNNYVLGNTIFNTGVFVSNKQRISNVFSNNTVNNKPLIYLENVSNIEITGDCSQVIVFNGWSLRIHGLIIQQTFVAIYLYNVTNSFVYNNVLIYNRIALLLDNVKDSIIFNNTLAYNSENMLLREISGNTFYLNTLYEGGFVVQTHIGTNFWDNGEIGNYWYSHSSDCLDRNRDNICDEPFRIGLILDRYPLKKPPPHVILYIRELSREFTTTPYYDLARDYEEKIITYTIVSVLTTLGASLIISQYIIRKLVSKKQVS